MHKPGFEVEYKKMMSAQICVDTDGNSHFVDGDGPIGAEIMFIGEAPGKKEDELKKPFVGSAGKLLIEMLEGIGLKREQVYITNIVKCRPPENRDPEPDEISAGRPYLAKEIETIKPKVIVFLGRHALNVFFPDQKISKVHGKAFKANNQVYYPIYHPAAALYRAAMKKDLEADFNKIPRLLKKINK